MAAHAGAASQCLIPLNVNHAAAVLAQVAISNAGTGGKVLNSDGRFDRVH